MSLGGLLSKNVFLAAVKCDSPQENIKYNILLNNFTGLVNPLHSRSLFSVVLVFMSGLFFNAPNTAYCSFNQDPCFAYFVLYSNISCVSSILRNLLELKRYTPVCFGCPFPLMFQEYFVGTMALNDDFLGS